MLPYPEGHKLKVRGRIIESAAKAFRANGIRDISVPFIMKGAGLTHGGFYAHFSNKDQLISETCHYAVSDTLSLLQKAAEQARGESKVETVIHYYLSKEHRDHMEIGCIFPALSSEVSRASQAIRRVYTSELQRMIDFLSELADIDTATGSALLGILVGTLLLARSVDDPLLSDSLLAAGKQQAIRLLQAKH